MPDLVWVAALLYLLVSVVGGGVGLWYAMRTGVDP